MRLFCAMMLVGSGCGLDTGRSVVEPPSDPMDDPSMMDPNQMGEFGEDPTVPLMAAVCDQRTWDLAPDTKQLDVSVVPTAAGATVFQVPKDGGAVRGFRIDQRGELFDQQMVEIRADRNYTGVSASTAASRLMVASVVDDKVALDMVSDDLATQYRLGDLSGSLVSDTPVLASRDSQFAITGGPEGLMANPYAGLSWQAAPAIELTKSSIVSMAAAAYLDDVLIGWSTADKTCHLQRFASRIESTRAFGCNDLRIAANPAAGRGLMVFEEDGTIYRTDLVIGGENELANKQRVTAHGSSPRVAFDGTRFWISYVDHHGDVVVGFVDGRGDFQSRALEGTRPEVGEAYDLAFYAGGVWVVGLTDTAFSAQHVCVRPAQ